MQNLTPNFRELLAETLLPWSRGNQAELPPNPERTCIYRVSRNLNNTLQQTRSNKGASYPEAPTEPPLQAGFASLAGSLGVVAVGEDPVTSGPRTGVGPIINT